MTEAKDAVETAIDKLKPIMAKLSFGAIMGYCSAMALKKVGKALAVVVGVGFIGLQTAVSTGYLAVDWTKISDDIKKSADTNADGKIDTEDMKVRTSRLCQTTSPIHRCMSRLLTLTICLLDCSQVYWKKFKSIMTHKIPSAGGFSFGFLYGVRYG